MYRVETIHGRHLLCGGVIPSDKVKPGQIWAAADGSNHFVEINASDTDWVDYSWEENGVVKRHSKLNFSFQCRYCLVLPSTVIPEDLT